MTRRLLLTVRDLAIAGAPIGRVVAETHDGLHVEIEAPVAWLREAEEGGAMVMDISFHGQHARHEPEIELDVNRKFQALLGEREM